MQPYIEHRAISTIMGATSMYKSPSSLCFLGHTVQWPGRDAVMAVIEGLTKAQAISCAAGAWSLK